MNNLEKFEQRKHRRNVGFDDKDIFPRVIISNWVSEKLSSVDGFSYEWVTNDGGWSRINVCGNEEFWIRNGYDLGNILSTFDCNMAISKIENSSRKYWLDRIGCWPRNKEKKGENKLWTSVTNMDFIHTKKDCGNLFFVMRD